MINSRHVHTWLQNCNDAMEENRKFLTELDTAIGDADHGNNMTRGFKKVIAQLPDPDGSDPDAILKTAAMSLISSVGGASGPLYGTMFLQYSNAVKGKKELNGEDLTRMFEAGMNGIITRGKANPGDKTILDACKPAYEAFKSATENGKSVNEALAAGFEASENGKKETIPMIAKKGRASYLGERSKGHQDPGATSFTLIFKALVEAAKS